MSDCLDRMDPDFVDFYNKNIKNIPKSHHYPVSEYRQNVDKFEAWRTGGANKFVPEKVPITMMCPVSNPTGEIKLYVYKPDEPTGPSPTYIHFHGGGGVVGRAGVDAPFLDRLHKESNALIIDADYRLAPEYPAPTAALDGFDVLEFVLKHAKELNADTSRIAVGGISAGGNIAAIVSQLARDKNIKLCLQALIVPVIDSRILKPNGDINPEIPYNSWTEYANNPILPLQRMQWFHNYLFGPEANEDRKKKTESALVSPMCGNLSNLAPAFIATAEIDVLRDEAKIYGDELKKQNIPVEYQVYKGMPHSYILSPFGFEQSRKAISETIAAISRSFALKN